MKKDELETIVSKVNSKTFSLTVNTCNSYIAIDESSARVIYQKIKDKRIYFAEFWSFFGIAISTFVTILTADFKERFMIPAAIWLSIFVVLFGLFIILTLIKLFQFLPLRKIDAEQAFVDDLKKSNTR